MTPEGSLTEWQRLEVEKMISSAMRELRIEQQAEHRENSAKLEKIMEAVQQAHGGGRLIAWAIPIIVAILTVVAEILRK